MATFTVWKFGQPDAAGRAAAQLARAESDGLVTVVDWAVVSWPVGAAHPRTRYAEDDVRRGAAWGAFWGLLLGMLFVVPVLGAATGAAVGALGKAMEHVGITSEQVETLRWQITEGTSALFVITDDADLVRVSERFLGTPRLLIDTNLTDAEQARLLEAFGTE